MSAMSNQLTPAAPVPAHEKVRAAYPSEKIDVNNTSGMVGPGATLAKSRDVASFVTGQSNAVLYGKGHNTNIFA